MKRTIGFLAVLWAIAWSGQAVADWTDARCDIHYKGSDQAEKMIPCTFGQRQEYVTITREDGVTPELAPIGEAEARLEGDTWMVTIDGEEVYEVPLAAIEGG